MNKKLEIIKERAETIISDMKCVLDDIKNFEGYDDLFTMENAMMRITREASDTVDLIRNMYDELEENE